MCSLSKITWADWPSVLLLAIIMELSHPVQAGNGTCPLHPDCKMADNDDGTLFCPICVHIEAERKEQKKIEQQLSTVSLIAPPGHSGSGYFASHETVSGQPPISNEAIVVSAWTEKDRTDVADQLPPDDTFISGYEVVPSQQESTGCYRRKEDKVMQVQMDRHMLVAELLHKKKVETESTGFSRDYQAAGRHDASPRNHADQV